MAWAKAPVTVARMEVTAAAGVGVGVVINWKTGQA